MWFETCLWKRSEIVPILVLAMTTAGDGTNHLSERLLSFLVSSWGYAERPLLAG